MNYTRRDALILGAGVAAAALMPFQVFAEAMDDAVAAFTGGADITDGGVTMTAPEIAENGNTVPIAVEAPGAVAIVVLASGNPSPDVVEFAFGPLSGSTKASTRCRLAGTQDVVALAKMADGSIMRGTATVKVTIGGCGG